MPWYNVVGAALTKATVLMPTPNPRCFRLSSDSKLPKPATWFRLGLPCLAPRRSLAPSIECWVEGDAVPADRCED
jgi:hypothetical protein